MRFALVPLVVLLATPAARPAGGAPVEPPPPDALAASLKQVKARRAALDALAGPHAPFDLTYLPRPTREIQALFALRPNVLFAHPDLAPSAALLDGIAGQVLRALGGTPYLPEGRRIAFSHLGVVPHPPGASPGFAALDQVLVCGAMTVTPIPNPTDGKTSQFIIGGTGFVARTARPFDWDAAVRGWFPKSEARAHRGAAFRVMKLDLGRLIPGFPAEDMEIAFYAAPDGRTLVADSVGYVTDLLDRLADGGAVAPPPGWDAVKTAAVAVAVNNWNKQWVWAQPPDPGPVVTAGAHRLFLAADQFALGLDVGPVTRFRALAFSRDPFQSRHARQGRKETMDRLSDRFAPSPADNPSPQWEQLAALTDALLKDGKATATPLGFEYATEAPGDLIGLLVRAAEAVAPPPQPVAAPPGFPASGPGSVGYVFPPPPPAPPPPLAQAGRSNGWPSPTTVPPRTQPSTPLPVPPVQERPGWYPTGHGFPGSGRPGL